MFAFVDVTTFDSDELHPLKQTDGECDEIACEMPLLLSSDNDNDNPRFRRCVQREEML